MTVSCAAPRCTDPMDRCVGWLPFCAGHAAAAVEHPAAVADLHPLTVWTLRFETEIAAGEKLADARWVA